MNRMKLIFDSRLENEAFARASVVAFLMPLNPNMDEIMEIKTILAEAVVNCMIHGYPNQAEGNIEVAVEVDDERLVSIEVTDYGVGIEDIEKAQEPLYTTKAELERSGMGMTIMQSFSDQFEVFSALGGPTKVKIKKQLLPHG